MQRGGSSYAAHWPGGGMVPAGEGKPHQDSVLDRLNVSG